MKSSIEYKEALPEKYKKHIDEIASIASKLPGVVIIHDLRDWAVAWMSPNGLERLGVTLEEITNLTAEEYYHQHFNSEDAKDYVPKILELLEKNNDENICTFFQQVRFKENPDWQWHMSSVKILARDEEGKPLLTITMAFPIDAMHHMAIKAARLLEEKNFIVIHYQNFAALGKREKEVLKLIALGKSSSQISEELFISIATVDTHRRNIKKKLDATTAYQISQYARAFDLIS